MLRDRDTSYGSVVRKRVAAMGITEVVTAPRSAWQNAYVERVIGSIRRECLDYVVIFNQRHLRRVLASYVDYYHRIPGKNISKRIRRSVGRKRTYFSDHARRFSKSKPFELVEAWRGARSLRRWSPRAHRRVDRHWTVSFGGRLGSSLRHGDEVRGESGLVSKDR